MASRTIQEVQTDFANNLGYQENVIWDLLSKDQGHLLKEKIKQSIPDPNSRGAIHQLAESLGDEEVAAEAIATFSDLLLDQTKIDSTIVTLKDELSLAGEKLNILKKKIDQLVYYEKTTDDVIQELIAEFKLNISKNRILREKIRSLIPDDEMVGVAIKNLNDVIGFSTEKCDELRKKVNKLMGDQKKNRKSVKEMRDILFKSVWAQRKYTNFNSMTAIIFICVTSDEEENALSASQFSCQMVFRCRKCINEADSSSCCMVFVDENGRVYSDWEDYCENNVLPEGVMVAPRRGIYTFNHDTVDLEVRSTPAAGLIKQTLKTADKTSAIVGFGSALVPVLALCSVPIAAPVLATAGAVALTTSAYGAVRSGTNLFDRKSHEQSISLADRDARGSWLGVTGGIIGAGAAITTRVLSAVAGAGQELSQASELVVNTMNITTIVISGTGVGNGVIDIILRYSDDEEIDAMDVMQLAASLALFTHSVYNFRLASQIIDETRNSTIKNYRENLSNRQRKSFDKIAKETIRIRGDTAGKIDIIRNVNEIPSKSYLNDLYKVNKQLNQENVRPAFRAAGSGEAGIVLNNEMHLDTKILRGNIDVIKQITQPIPQSQNDAAATSTGGTRTNTALFSKNGEQSGQSGNVIRNLALPVLELSKSIICVGRDKIVISDECRELFYHISSVRSFEDVITTIGNCYGGRCLKFFLHMAERFVVTQLNELQNLLKMKISSESILYKMLEFCFHEFKIRLLNKLQDSEAIILRALSNYYESLNATLLEKLETKCKKCLGSFVIVDL